MNAKVGDWVASKPGQGQPRIIGVVRKIAGGIAEIELQDGTIRRRSLLNLVVWTHKRQKKV